MNHPPKKSKKKAYNPMELDVVALEPERWERQIRFAA